jgi:hypothetical protein
MTHITVACASWIAKKLTKWFISVSWFKISRICYHELSETSNTFLNTRFMVTLETFEPNRFLFQRFLWRNSMRRPSHYPSSSYTTRNPNTVMCIQGLAVVSASTARFNFNESFPMICSSLVWPQPWHQQPEIAEVVYKKTALNLVSLSSPKLPLPPLYSCGDLKDISELPQRVSAKRFLVNPGGNINSILTNELRAVPINTMTPMWWWTLKTRERKFYISKHQWSAVQLVC